jgi:membrane-associated protease RseP (regulator of RpoE activity)
MEQLLPLLLPLLLLVAVPHELAHLLAARALGITVLEFGVGLPPRAFSFRWKGIAWSICWLLPMGAYVKVKGEDRGTEPDDFAARPAWQRAVVVLAGPAANLLVAALAAGILLAVYGRPQLPSGAHIAASSQLVGWLGLAQVMDELAFLSIPTGVWFLALLASLSLGLGLANLLPLPPLDGSRVAISLVESLFRRPILTGGGTLARVNAAGVAALLLLFAAVTAMDVARVATGQALLVVRP